MKRVVALLAALTMTLGVTACAGDLAGGAPAPGGTSEPRSQAADGSGFGPIPLGDFSARDFEGSSVGRDVFADYDLTMANLWTTTCGYCIEEMPALSELRDEFQGEGVSFSVIGICMDVGSVAEVNEANLGKARKNIAKTGAGFPSLIPDDVLLRGRLSGVQAFPESFFVDRKGNVVSEPYMGGMPKIESLLLSALSVLVVAAASLLVAALPEIFPIALSPSRLALAVCATVLLAGIMTAAFSARLLRTDPAEVLRQWA